MPGYATQRVTNGHTTGLAHWALWKMMPSVWRWPERTRLTPWRTLALHPPAVAGECPVLAHDAMVGMGDSQSVRHTRLCHGVYGVRPPYTSHGSAPFRLGRAVLELLPPPRWLRAEGFALRFLQSNSGTAMHDPPGLAAEGIHAGCSTITHLAVKPDRPWRLLPMWSRAC